MSPTLVVYCHYETKSRGNVQQQADTTVKLKAVSVLRQPQYWPWPQPTLDTDVSLSVVPNQRQSPTLALCQSNVGIHRRRPPMSMQCQPLPTSDVDVSTMLEQCWSLLALAIDVRVVSVQYRTQADLNSQHFYHPSVLAYPNDRNNGIVGNTER